MRVKNKNNNENNNSIYIKNSLKANNELFKTLELLGKLGVIPTRGKKKSKKAAQGEGEKEEEQIRSSSDQMIGNTSVIPAIVESRFPTRQILQLGDQPRPLTIEDFKNIQKESDTRLALLKDQVEKTQEQQGMLTAYGGLLGSQLSAVQQRIKEGGMSERVNPFRGVEGQGDVIEEGSDDPPFTNQGTQDIPEELLKADVTRTPTEILEDPGDIDEGIKVPTATDFLGSLGIEAPVEEEEQQAKVELKEQKKRGPRAISFDEKMATVIKFHELLQRPSAYQKKEIIQAYLNELSKLGYRVNLRGTRGTKDELEEQIDQIFELEYKKIKKLKKI